MQGRRFYVKLAFIVFLMVFLLVPQAFIFGVVSERAGWREQAYQSIGQSWPGEQTFAGPLLVLPYQLTRTVKEKVKDADGTEHEISRDTLSQERLLLMPTLPVNSIARYVIGGFMLCQCIAVRCKLRGNSTNNNSPIY